MLVDEALDFVLNNPTPFFLFDLARIEEEYQSFQSSFPDALIYYAVKANNHPTLLAALRDVGASFEVGSWEEIALLKQLGVSSTHIIFSAPVKIPNHISRAYSVGINTYAFDSRIELEKLAKYAPGARVLVRIRVSDQGTLFPLNMKFGVSNEEALEMLHQTEELGLVPYGITFHVGSQCNRLESWSSALEQAFLLWSAASDLNLSCLNIGGGFPVDYSKPVVPIESIAKTVHDWLPFFPRETRLCLEPGRKVAADAGTMVASVIGKARRQEKEWLYLDVGALHGLFETFQSDLELSYPIRLIPRSGQKNRPSKKYVISGPTCDPDDTVIREALLPEPEVGDRIIISKVGAYSQVYSTEFMSFPRPEIYFISNAKGAHLDADYEERMAPRG
jgi:ornithine decarboxylase